jgi:hypothetical protein
MLGMKLQFRTIDIFVVTGFIAVWIGGILAVMRLSPSISVVTELTYFVLLLSPFWIPIFFAGYAFGRKALTGRILMAFAVADSIGVGVNFLWRRYNHWS